MDGTTQFLYFTIFYILLIPLHELIHYISAKILGYKGKLVLPNRYSIGIRPIGIKDNVIGAIDVQFFLLAPLPFTFVWLVISYHFLNSNIIECIGVGFIVTFACCFKDIFNTIKVYKTWKKSIMLHINCQS